MRQRIAIAIDMPAEDKLREQQSDERNKTYC